MKRTIHILPLLFCFSILMILIQFPVSAAKKGNQETLAKKGKLIFKDEFKIPAEYTKEFQEVESGWKVKTGHANWKHTKKGIESVWETGHMPVLVYSGEFGDAVIEVDFRFQKEEGKWSACRISATNPQLNPRAYAASVWANGLGQCRQ